MEVFYKIPSENSIHAIWSILIIFTNISFPNSSQVHPNTHTNFMPFPKITQWVQLVLSINPWVWGLCLNELSLTYQPSYVKSSLVRMRACVMLKWLTGFILCRQPHKCCELVIMSCPTDTVLSQSSLASGSFSLYTHTHKHTSTMFPEPLGKGVVILKFRLWLSPPQCWTLKLSNF